MVLLPMGEVHVWLMPQPKEIDALLLASTTDAERLHAETMMSPRRQHEWLGGRALLRRCIAHYTGYSATELDFKKTEAGKLFLAMEGVPAFNLSHGPGWIGCAVAMAECVGIDIENEKRNNRIDDIAARYFHPLEQEALEKTGDEKARKSLFFRLWTLKEAYIKAIGETINSVKLQALVFSSEGHDEPRALFALPPGNWQFLQQRFDVNHHLALACQRASCDTVNREVSDPLLCRLWMWDAESQSPCELTGKWQYR